MLCGRCPGPPADRTGLSLDALKLLKAYQRLDIEAIAGLRLADAVEREVEGAMRDFMRLVLERDPRSLRSSTRSAPATRPPAPPRAHLTRRIPTMVFDSGSDGDAHALERLETDMIGWLTTVTPDGQPQTFPIWFLWEDGEAPRLQRPAREAQRATSRPTRGSPPPQRQRQGRRRRDRGGRGAHRRRDAAAVTDNAAYLAKYGAWIDEYLTSAEEMATIYNVPLRIRPTRGRAFGA